MLTLYELEAVSKDYQQMRLQEREAEIKRLLSQPQPARRSRMKFRLPKFILKWVQPQAVQEQLQECPEIA